MKKVNSVICMILIFILTVSFAISAEAAESGTWRQSNGRWWYEYKKGGYPYSQWLQDKNIWYYFDSEGWMVTGWRNIDSAKYYFNSSGAMVTGWQKISNTWYYFNKSGAMQTGWILYNNKWYYLHSDGKMATGWLTDKGTKYYLNNDGDMVTGWKKISGDWYYFNNSGGMMTGWLQDGYWYYLDNSGKMKTGWIEYKGNWYYLKSSGAMATGSLKIDDITYTFTASGELSYPAATSKETVVVDEEISYTTEYQDDYNRFIEDGNKTIQKGAKGTRRITYEVIYTFGKETSRSVVSNNIIKNAVNEVISVPKKKHTTDTVEEYKTEDIPYSTITQNDSSRQKGDANKVIQEGKTGTRKITYSVTYKDGVETGRSVKSDTVIKQPIDEIISVATGEYTISYETETINIPFETTVIDTENMNVGEEYIEIAGQDGQKEVTYAIKKDCNGNIVSWDVYSEKVIKNAVNQVMYRGTFIPSITYAYVNVPNLPECDPNLRDTNIDEACALWAMEMAVCGTVKHSGQGHAESVGGWGSIDEVVYGREYTEINPDNGQVYSGNTSLGSHGGEGLANGHRWGAGCVARTTTLPGGGTNTVYYACARSELD